LRAEKPPGRMLLTGITPFLKYRVIRQVSPDAGVRRRLSIVKDAARFYCQL
jgi:hypothetical protein